MDTHDTNASREPHGFAGLSSLVSNVDGLIRAIDGTRDGQTAQALHRATMPPVREDGGQTSGRLLGWGIAFVVGLGLLVMASVNDSSDGPSAAPTRRGGATTSSPQVPAASSAPSEMPPRAAAGHVFSLSELRYCLAEDIRLEAARSLLMSEDEVRRFNGLVVDYNSKCGSYRYRESTLSAARRDVEARRAALQAEGIARFRQ